MRLWHQSIIDMLPRKQLLGQHRECCALRGNGWGRKHKIVDYVFKHNPYILFLYHTIIINKMNNMFFNVNYNWRNPFYRGENCIEWDNDKLDKFDKFEKDLQHENYKKHWIYYEEHNDEYLNECLDNLKNKGIIISLEEK